MSNRQYWGRDEYEENSLEAHRDFMIARDGTFGRPDLDQGPRELSENALERARAAMTFGPRDHRFANLVNLFSRMLR